MRYYFPAITATQGHNRKRCACKPSRGNIESKPDDDQCTLVSPDSSFRAPLEYTNTLIKALNSSTSPKLVDEMSPGQPVSCLADPPVDQPITAREATAWANPQARDTHFRSVSVSLKVLPSL